ncbi:hypothetical protein V1520DRAFT_349489 [Lipomyces starkeyi]|uniref:Uncharacterized protein n=1 Tax=Lipomyces starkeyi NRRL Y-11557 TaxID=675824 RepID=A0A1E3Q716_LIPST|nr:hypothetical protein LIPSTDRAFT_70363 [Lipomyces starkeyi NRRL Y-11557]
MADSPMAPTPGSSASLPSQGYSKPTTCIDFVNPLLWVLFTNLAFSLGPSIMQASDAAADTKDIILAIGVGLFLLSKLVEAVVVATLVSTSPSLSGRTVTTTILLAAHVGLFGPMFFSDLTLFARFTFMLWSLSLGGFFGICLAFGLGRSEPSNRKGDRDIKED